MRSKTIEVLPCYKVESSLLDHGGSLHATADPEFLHVNTVRRRLGRLLQAVGRNPLDSSDRVDFGIAL